MIDKDTRKKDIELQCLKEVLPDCDETKEPHSNRHTDKHKHKDKHKDKDEDSDSKREETPERTKFVVAAPPEVREYKYLRKRQGYIKCPHCEFIGFSNTELKKGYTFWCCVCVLALCAPCCACIPYFVSDFQDTIHTCKMCQAEIKEFKAYQAL